MQTPTVMEAHISISTSLSSSKVWPIILSVSIMQKTGPGSTLTEMLCQTVLWLQ